MKVIGAGYGRTGTASMMEALSILGFGPCYHSFQVLRRFETSHPELWLDGYRGRGLDAERLFRGYPSVMDWPAADFYKDIIKEFPEAKVILTHRDPDSWWKSISTSIHLKEGPLSRSWGLFVLLMFVPFGRRWWYMIQHVETMQMCEEDAKANFLRHNAEVKAHVPSGKLLVFSVKEGWGPLCAFLDVPVPDVPFPRANSGTEMRQLLRAISIGGWLLMIFMTSLTVAVVWGAWEVGGIAAAIPIAALFVLYFAFCVVLARRSDYKTDGPAKAVNVASAPICSV